MATYRSFAELRAVRNRFSAAPRNQDTAAARKRVEEEICWWKRQQQLANSNKERVKCALHAAVLEAVLKA